MDTKEEIRLLERKLELLQDILELEEKLNRYRPSPYVLPYNPYQYPYSYWPNPYIPYITWTTSVSGGSYTLASLEGEYASQDQEGQRWLSSENA